LVEAEVAVGVAEVAEETVDSPVEEETVAAAVQAVVGDSIEIPHETSSFPQGCRS
jgi:hypothetical protein